MLNDVYSYSQSGKSSSNLDNHISNNQEQLTQWIAGMDNFLKYHSEASSCCKY